MDAQLIEKIQQALDAGLLSEDQVLHSCERHAIAEASDKYDSATTEITMGLLGAFLLFPFLGPLGAIAAAGIAGNQIVKKHRTGTKVIKAIEEKRVKDLSPLLPEGQRRIYQAVKNAPKALPPARVAPELAAVPVVASPELEAIAPDETRQQVAPVQAEEYAPRVATIDPQQVIALPHVSDTGMPQAQPVGLVETCNIAALVASKLRSILFTANPRHGKGIVVSHAWRQAKQQNPGLTVWVIDPKNHPSESGYYAGVDRYWGRRLEQYPQNDPDVARELEQFILEWRTQSARPTLLIIDELVLLKALMPKWYKDIAIPTVVAEASTGETDKRFCWGITQSPQVGDVGMSGGARSCLHLVAIESRESVEHYNAIARSYNGLPEMPSDLVLNSSPRGTVAYVSWLKQWFCVPVMAVPSPVPMAHRMPEPPIEPEPVADDSGVPPEMSERLLEWMRGTGQKYALEDGWFTAAIIKKHWRFKLEGKTTAATTEQLLEWLKPLAIARLIELRKGPVDGNVVTQIKVK